jgi:hypothetical protein
MMGSKGPGAPTLAQILEAPRTYPWPRYPMPPPKYQPPAEDMKMGRRR